MSDEEDRLLIKIGKSATIEEKTITNSSKENNRILPRYSTFSAKISDEENAAISKKLYAEAKLFKPEAIPKGSTNMSIKEKPPLPRKPSTDLRSCIPIRQKSFNESRKPPVPIRRTTMRSVSADQSEGGNRATISCNVNENQDRPPLPERNFKVKESSVNNAKELKFGANAKLFEEEVIYSVILSNKEKQSKTIQLQRELSDNRPISVFSAAKEDKFNKTKTSHAKLELNKSKLNKFNEAKLNATKFNEAKFNKAQELIERKEKQSRMQEFKRTTSNNEEDSSEAKELLEKKERQDRIRKVQEQVEEEINRLNLLEITNNKRFEVANRKLVKRKEEFAPRSDDFASTNKEFPSRGNIAVSSLSSNDEFTSKSNIDPRRDDFTSRRNEFTHRRDQLAPGSEFPARRDEFAPRTNISARSDDFASSDESSNEQDKLQFDKPPSPNKQDNLAFDKPSTTQATHTILAKSLSYEGNSTPAEAKIRPILKKMSSQEGSSEDLARNRRKSVSISDKKDIVHIISRQMIEFENEENEGNSSNKEASNKNIEKSSKVVKTFEEKSNEEEEMNAISFLDNTLQQHEDAEDKSWHTNGKSSFKKAAFAISKFSIRNPLPLEKKYTLETPTQDNKKLTIGKESKSSKLDTNFSFKGIFNSKSKEEKVEKLLDRKQKKKPPSPEALRRRSPESEQPPQNIQKVINPEAFNKSVTPNKPPPNYVVFNMRENWGQSILEDRRSSENRKWSEDSKWREDRNLNENRKMDEDRKWSEDVQTSEDSQRSEGRKWSEDREWSEDRKQSEDRKRSEDRMRSEDSQRSEYRKWSENIQSEATHRGEDKNGSENRKYTETNWGENEKSNADKKLNGDKSGGAVRKLYENGSFGEDRKFSEDSKTNEIRNCSEEIKWNEDVKWSQENESQSDDRKLIDNRKLSEDTNMSFEERKLNIEIGLSRKGLEPVKFSSNLKSQEETPQEMLDANRYLLDDLGSFSIVKSNLLLEEWNFIQIYKDVRDNSCFKKIKGENASKAIAIFGDIEALLHFHNLFVADLNKTVTLEQFLNLIIQHEKKFTMHVRDQWKQCQESSSELLEKELNIAPTFCGATQNQVKKYLDEMHKLQHSKEQDLIETTIFKRVMNILLETYTQIEYINHALKYITGANIVVEDCGRVIYKEKIPIRSEGFVHKSLCYDVFFTEKYIILTQSKGKSYVFRDSLPMKEIIHIPNKNKMKVQICLRNVEKKILYSLYPGKEDVFEKILSAISIARINMF